MGKRPGGDIGAMRISKEKAANAVPFGAAQTIQPTAPHIGGPKSLTVKLDGDTYAALRAYCYGQEMIAGTRLTHQQIMVDALKAFLADKAGL